MADIKLPYIYDTEDDNTGLAPIDYTTDLVKKMYDTLKHVIKLGDEKTGKPEDDNSDVAVNFTRLTGFAGWSSNPRLVGSNMGLEDQNIWFYSRIDVNAYSENWLSDFHYIGANNHFTEFGNPFPSSDQQAVIDSINNNTMLMAFRVKPELMDIMTGFYLSFDTGRDFAHIKYDNNGVLGDTLYTNRNTLLYNNNGVYNTNSMCQIYYGSAKYITGTDYWGSEILASYPDSTYLSGSPWDLEVIHYFSDMPSVIINPSTNPNTINNINNTFNQNNTNNYNNTYTYNNQTYNYNYGDNYITIYYPDGSDGLPFDDIRNIFNDTLNELDINVVMPDYDTIKYGDMGDFYIEPLHQYDTIPSAPEFDGSIDLDVYPSFFGSSVSSLLNFLPNAISGLITATFVFCILVNRVKR